MTDSFREYFLKNVMILVGACKGTVFLQELSNSYTKFAVFSYLCSRDEGKCTEYHHDSDCAGGPNGVQQRQGTAAAAAGTAGAAEP